MAQAAAVRTHNLQDAAETTSLLLLGRRADPNAERGTICPGEVPSSRGNGSGHWRKCCND